MNIQALITLWNVTQVHPDTSGGRAAAAVLLALYNGKRFPLDLTELRRLDDTNRCAALEVIANDLCNPVTEVHQWLNQAAGSDEFGARFEHLAYEYGFKGRRKKAMLPPMSSESLIFKLDGGEL